MPATLTYPGVYVEEVPSGVRTVTGVATSITAFIGRALRGPIDRPVRIQSFADFSRTFGGLWSESTLGYSVSQYFLNGGSDAWLVRVHRNATTAVLALAPDLQLEAANPGAWGSKLRVRVDYDTSDKDDAAPVLFNLSVRDTDTNTTEVWTNLSTTATHARYVNKVLAEQSRLVRVTAGTAPTVRPTAHGAPPAGKDPLLDNASSEPFGASVDGDEINDNSVSQPALEQPKQGLWMLENVELFNLLCIPPFGRADAAFTPDIGAQTREAARRYCEQRRAMFIVDPLVDWTEAADVLDAGTGMESAGFGLTRSRNAALYFPYIRCPDPLRNGSLESFAPSGAVAGVFARTDATRGVWKAPAGIDASLSGVSELAVTLTDGENGQLNPVAVNCLRQFAGAGRVVWGARTSRGADRLADEYKYVPVRRLALFIEESLFQGTQWVVFEPNDEPLWAQIRLNVGAFMQSLFRQGAFQGSSPREAYLVKCDAETTTQDDVNRGIVNIVVGFAPLKPAEFVVLRIQQLAGRVQA